MNAGWPLSERGTRSRLASKSMMAEGVAATEVVEVAVLLGAAAEELVPKELDEELATVRLVAMLMPCAAFSTASGAVCGTFEVSM